MSSTLPAPFARMPMSRAAGRNTKPSHCPAEISLRPLLAARAVHLPLSVALFWLGSTVPVQAVQTFTTLTERVVVLRRVPLDCALLAFAVCCITVEELARR